MKTFVAVLLLILIYSAPILGQRACSTFEYQEKLMSPGMLEKKRIIENFTTSFINQPNQLALREAQGTIIRIPVVVHILYHYPEQNVSDSQVYEQIDILNRCFRKKNADTSLIPSYFLPYAADCEIEFQLAISDPSRRNTSGIIRKYTPIHDWEADDRMKFSSEMGSDAWDPKSYLNIWVCNMRGVVGYSSMHGSDSTRDGVVIATNVFGRTLTGGLNQGKTAVHEVGHWLNLRHLWGDDYCGDDGVSDTPKQGGYNSGCPSTNHITCGNGPLGDMFMNYMDFTDDACVHMFTQQQKLRMRASFATGGTRNSILNSKGLQTPLIFETPVPDQAPRWLRAQFYPNPVSGDATLDLSYDVRWIGKSISVINMQGQVVMRVVVNSRLVNIDTRSLKPGLYLLSAKKEDGDFIRQKFVKQ